MVIYTVSATAADATGMGSYDDSVVELSVDDTCTLDLKVKMMAVAATERRRMHHIDLLGEGAE